MINDYFDRIYCVNLDRRQDKWMACEKEFEKHNLAVTRYAAIDGSTVPYKGRLKPGAVGNSISHSNILRIAEENNYDSVLILEDDVEFDPQLQDKFNDWIRQVPNDWDLLYLGGNHNWVKELPLCAPNLMKVTNTYSTHAYAIKKTVYKIVYEMLEKLLTEGDVMMAQIQKSCNGYSFVPNLAWQRPCISDVHNIFTDYSFLNPYRNA